MSNMRVLLADDHQLTMRGVRALIESMSGFEVCGEATDGRQAVELVERLTPDIVVMDISMPEMDGIEAARQIKRLHPNTEILAFTSHEEESMICRMFEAGVRSYIFKTDAGQNLEAALRAVAEHKPYFTSEVGEVLFSRVLHGKSDSPDDPESARLTPREREIVQLLAEGKSNKEVGELLGITLKTAETHRASIMKKLKLDSFAALVRYAIRNRMVSP